MNSNKKQVGQGNGFWTPARTAVTFLACGLLATFGITSCNSSQGTSSTNANATKVTMTVNGAQPNPAPAPQMIPASALDASLKTVDGKDFKLSELKDKVVVIDLWATWCGPCRYEVPELVKMQNEYGPKGFEIVGLDIDPKSDSPEDVQSFMKDFKINYKVAFAEEPLARSLMKGGNIPQSLVIGRDGKIVKHFIGFSPEKTAPLMREAIEQALQ
ncbi:MAG TPA: TlpA disulfide reductase family protein [Pyrinomonadaceae bacterium]